MSRENQRVEGTVPNSDPRPPSDRSALDEPSSASNASHEQISSPLPPVDEAPWVMVDAPTKLPSAADVSRLEELCLQRDFEGAIAFVDSLVQDGISVENVLVALIAPTARRLGNMAETEQHPFADLASALDTLQKVIEPLRGR